MSNKTRGNEGILCCIGDSLYRIEEFTVIKEEWGGWSARPHLNKARDLPSVLTPFKLPELNGPSVGLHKP